jgi:hypothetical protein
MLPLKVDPSCPLILGKTSLRYRGIICGGVCGDVWMEQLVGRLVSSHFLGAMILVGFAFTLIQGTRKRLTYRMRLISSAISLTIAINLIAMGVMYIVTKMTVFVMLGGLSLFLAYRLVRTDIKTWRWFREQSCTSK